MVLRPFIPAVAVSTLFSCLAVQSATAATLDIAAQASIVADLQYENGAPPAGLDIGIGFLTDIGQGFDSHVDDPAAVQSDDVSVQVGNLFSAPPVPYYQSGFDQTELAGNGQARGFGFVESLMTPDPDNLRPGRLDRTMVGQASLNFGDLSVDAEAEATSVIGRSQILSNTTNADIDVTVSARALMSISATADDIGSFSSATGIFNLYWLTTGAVTMNQTLHHTIGGSADDDDPGVVVDHSVIPGNALFNGLRVEATATATGTGALTEATYQIDRRVTFDITLAPNATILFNFFQSQDLTSTYTAPDPTPTVPLPAPALALLSGLGALAALRRRGR
jgi:hypothetical protein